jgi:hypothetical protein
MTYKQGIATACPHPIDDPIHTQCYIGCAFTALARLRKNRPPGHGLCDFGCGEAFVIAVVPLGEIGGDFSLCAFADQITGAAGTLPGTAKHKTEIPSLQKRA